MFVVLGFIPTYIVAGILKAMGVLRIPREVELAGLDYVEEQGLVVERQEIINAELIEANR
jgi:ammonia channel protein AmtB